MRFSCCAVLMSAGTSDALGHVDWDRRDATNERVVLRAPPENRSRVLRNLFVRIADAKTSTQFLGRTVAGPFFNEHAPSGPEPDACEGAIAAEIEIQGELVEGRPRDTNNRP